MAEESHRRKNPQGRKPIFSRLSKPGKRLASELEEETLALGWGDFHRLGAKVALLACVRGLWNVEFWVCLRACLPA